MTFLQPFILWALPLILLPVLIHFLNRMRHRPQPWAAMRFLLAATRSSVSNTKLRQFLVLLFRVLAVLMLVLFVARPLAGGWLGWALSPAADAILILLDRSASMEHQIGTTTRREQGLKMVAQAAAEFQEKSHLVLIDSATRAPQELAAASSLLQLPSTASTDTAADIPSMLHTAANWLVDNRVGTAEIWIVSDAQQSNWLPEDSRWKNTVAQLSGRTQKVRVRALLMNQEPQPNVSVSLRELVRGYRGEKSELQFVLDLQRNGASSGPIPVLLTLDGARSQREIALDGQSLRWRHKVDLGPQKKGGWGSFSLPSDGCRQDNTAFFVYGADTLVRACVVCSDREAARYLRFAAADRKSRPADLLSIPELGVANLADYSLVIWQESLPSGDIAQRLSSFVQQGGVLLFFPPGDNAGTQTFEGLGWKATQTAESDNAFRILRWDEDQGPLARSDEHLSLPVDQLWVQQRQGIAGAKNLLAAFEDGAPFLARENLGKGEIYFCASSLNKQWSSLSDGDVLVPMLQRLLQSGARRLQQVSSLSCGELSAADLTLKWTSIDSADPKDIRTQAGVYQAGEHMVAVNRPAIEDEPEILEASQMQKLFGDLSFQTLQERRQTGQLQGEIWRLFLVCMLLFLIAESILVLPPRKPIAQPIGLGTGKERSA